MPEVSTLAKALASTRARFIAGGIADAAMDARLLVEAATGATRLDAVRSPQRPVPPEDLARIEMLVARRLAGEPVHRILGHRMFHGLDLALNADTLEPRDDTEALVELALEAIGPKRDESIVIIDLGTGTGAIALALLAELPKARAVGVDIAPGALAAASANARAAGVAARFAALHSDWFAEVDGFFDLIVANPPYIRSSEIDHLDREVRDHDPRAALDGGADGLDAYRAIASGANAHLAPDGRIAVEIGHDQKTAVVAVFATGGFAPTGFRADLGGHDRAIAFARTGAGDRPK